MAANLRDSALLTLAIAVVGAGAPEARADRAPVVVAEAVARAHPGGGEAVYLLSEGKAKRRRGRFLGPAGRRGHQRATVLWRSSEHEHIVTDLRWSRRRDALAFATRDHRGAMTLVVVLVGGTPDGHVMKWPIPAVRRASSVPSTPTVTWLGRDRVGFGRTELRPDVVASWRVLQ